VDEDISDETLRDVSPDRREFVKRVVAVTAFSAPFIASYDLQSLSASVAHASSNLTS
jgi:hypothetical protein